MPQSFISPYDDFERFLHQEGGADLEHQVIPVLFGLTPSARERFNFLSEILTDDEDERQRDAINELDHFLETALGVFTRFDGRAFSPDLELFLDRLLSELILGPDSARDFFGRVVAFLPEIEDIDTIERKLTLVPWNDQSETILVLERVWIGPLVATSAIEPTFDKDRTVPLLPAGAKIGKPVIGIIDDAIGFLNDAFENDTASRFDAIWLQKRPTLDRHGLDLGPVLEGRGHIDPILAQLQNADQSRSLAEVNYYKTLNAETYGVDFFKGTDHEHTHGTHMLGLAAEIDGDHLKPGERDILAVQLPPFALQDMTGHYLSFFAFLGLRWMLRRMIASSDLDSFTNDSARPLILNISLGSLAGPKNGSGNFEREFSREIHSYEAATGGRVTAFFSYGNYYETRQVAVAAVRPNETTTLSWQLMENDPTASFIELRADADFAVSVTHSATSAQTPPTRPPSGQYEDLSLRGTRVDARIYGNAGHRYSTALGGPSLVPEDDGVIVALRPTHGLVKGHSGYWRIVLHGLEAPATVTCQIQSGGTPSSYLGYLQHGRQSQFELPQNDQSVILTKEGSFSALIPVTDHNHRCVGAAAFGAQHQPRQPMPYTSQGGLFPANRSPSLSCVVQSRPNADGLDGLGTLSGTTRITGGSSAAAAVATKEFLRHIRSLHANRDTYANYPDAVKTNIGVDPRLGSRTI